MNGFGIWLQPVSNWLVVWLISKWGAALVMIGTLALAASAAAYLTSASDRQAQVGGSMPGAVTPVPTQCNLSVLVVAPDIACNDR